MNANDVYTDLDGFIHDNSIDLWEAATDPDGGLTAMKPMLQLFGIDSAYVLNSVVLTKSPSGTSVTLTGTGTFSSTGSYDVNATLLYTENGDVFSLSLNIIGDWGFSEFFGTLPQTFMQDPSVGIGLRWYPSVLSGMKVRSAVFYGQTGENQTLTMSGTLLEPDNQYLLDKTPMIGPWPLRLSGTVVMPDSTRSYPILSLNATGNSTIINVAAEPGVQGPSGMALNDPGLTLIVNTLVPAQADVDAFSTIQVYADFVLGQITGQLSTFILSTDSIWNLTVRFDKNATLVQGLAQLTAIFGVELPIPMNFPVLKDFYISEIDLNMQNNAAAGAFPSFSILNLAVTIRATNSEVSWNPPIPYVTISNVGTRWVWGWTQALDKNNGGYSKIYSLSGSVFGTINFGDSSSGEILPEPIPEGPDDSDSALVLDSTLFSLNMKMSLPNFIISGSLAEGSYIPIGQALTYFFGNPGPSTGPQSMNVTRLRFSADPIGQNYFADATIQFGADPKNPDEQQGWEIDLIVITIILNQLEFFINVDNGSVSGGISGTLYLEQDDPTDYTLPRIVISAEYPPQNPDIPQGWTLAGYLYPGTSIDLVKLVYKFIYGETETVPEWVPKLTVDQLSVVFTTGSSSGDTTTGPSYKFLGTISMRWEVEIFGTELKVNASTSVDMQKASDSSTATGTVSGSFSVNSLSLTASLTFGVPEPTYLFKVQFEELWLQATTSWRGEKDNRHQVISLQLGGVTVGDVLEYLVNLAAPTLGFELDSPWDVLKKIELSRFVLTIDPQENVIEFVYNTNVDLVIAKLDSIGVRYTKEGSGEGKVDMILTGSFLGQKYGDDDPLSWDVINDPPPAVPGEGVTLVNLRYLGIGQHVTFSGPTPDTVAASIAKLKEDMTPGDGMPNTMEYSADSQWLIGLDIELMQTVNLGFIFNDPKLYGLSIALGGERAGSLAGLRFEILYKKITDSIGMFRIEFQVPDMFRTIQLGAVSLTLGIIVIEIYTNGNFKIDLGFPYDRNFDRAFCIQASIFIGRGGFYFGVLNGDTSTQVPRITNGNFSPVIELGIGMAVGVGREIKEGILSGGAYVELEVIFQGVLAWFNPTSSGAASATYFKCQGIAAIHGKVYGAVDFKVVKVSITLEAYAQVSIIYEVYKPMLIDLSVDVQAKASVKVLFVKVHFSFHVHLELSFTVGSSQPTPWIIDESYTGDSYQVPGSDQNTSVGRKLTRPSALRRNKHTRIQALRNTHLGKHQQRLRSLNLTDALVDLSSTYQLNWTPDKKVFVDSPRKAHMTLLPLFSVGDIPINWNTTIPTNASPNYRSAFVLFADTGMSPDATDVTECAVRSAAHSGMSATDDDTSYLAADILTEGLVRYTIDALPRDESEGNVITAGQIDLLLEQLDLPETFDTGFNITNLATFFSTNINLWISGDTDPTPDEKSAMVIPMPPFVRWTSPQAGDVDFSDKNEVGPVYEWTISQYLNSYFPVNGDESEKPVDDLTKYESFAGFMFRDFCLMLAQSAVKEMQSLMNETSVTVTSSGGTVQNLSDIANTFPTATINYAINSGDTVDSVAENVGATAAELEFLNPGLADDLLNDPVGSNIQLKLGISPEVIALDNADEVFAVDHCDLGTLVHQAAENDTLADIATLFQVLQENGDPDVARLLEFNDTSLPELTSLNNILDDSKVFNLPAQTFNNAPDDFVQLRTAAAFFIRYIDLTIFVETTIPEQATWYVQAITTLNADLLGTLFKDQTIPSDIELPPGQVLSVPNAYNNAYNTSGNTNSYTTVNGDTLNRIGYTLTLQQDYGSDSPENPPEWQQEWLTFQQGVTSNGTNSWSIAAQNNIPVDTGQTIESLVRRLIIDATWTGTDPENPSEGNWTYDWDAVAVWIGDATILASLATVTVPDAKTATDNSLSFTVLSKTYGLGITEAAEKLKAVNGLYADGTSLKIKLLPAQDIDVLVQDILQGESFASIVNQASRLLMSGLQLPKPVCENGGDLPCESGEHVVPDFSVRLPVYDLTGQQFDLPVNASEPTETALTLSLFSEETWIELFESITVVEGDTLEELEAQYQDLKTYNPGLDESTFKVGMVLLTEPVVTSLDYSYTNQDVLDESPDTGLSIEPLSIPVGTGPDPISPTVLPISGTVPITYGLEHSIEIQSPVTLAIPQVPDQTNVTGNPTLWMFPAGLLEKAVKGVSTKYDVLYSPLGSPAGEDATEIESSTYGMLMPFNVKRLDDSDSQFSLLGVDTDKREQLITLIDWLKTNGSGDTKAYLLLSPAPNSGNTSGLTVLNPDPTQTFLIKSNLSTESAPPTLLMRSLYADEDTPVPYFASLSSLTDFLTLLWEGSVVGGTGYYFGPGQKIPGSAFDEEGNITLQILVIVDDQQALAPDGRALLPFNNCVLLANGFDSNSYALFVESADGSETSVQALVPPGNVGFELMTHNPPTQVGTVPSKEIDLQNLYSLLTFEVLKITGSPFEATASGMPVLPEPSDGTAVSPSEQQRLSRKAKKRSSTEEVEETEELYWYYQQVLPVSRFVSDSVEEAAPNVVGLPLPEADPYQGYGTEGSIPTANFAFGFGDALGNRTTPVVNNGSTSDEPGITPIQVGYTDNIVGITEWPAIARYYNITKGSSGADLMAVISARPSEILPTPSQTGEVNTDVIDQQIQKYGQIYYQLVQPGITGWIVSSLKFIENAKYGNEGQQITDISPLWKFSGGAYAYARSVQAFSSAKPEGTTTLQDIIDKYGIRYTELAQANADSLVSQLFGSTEPVVPGYYPFVEYQSINTLYTLPPEGWPKPATAEDLLGYPENTSLVLRLETPLNIPTAEVPTGDELPTSDLQTFADNNNTTVELLAASNSGDHILQNGFVFTVEVDDGVTTVEVSDTINSFDLVVAAFADQGVHITVGGLAATHAGLDNIFATGENLKITHYVTKSGDTLDTNSSNVSTTDLVNNNVDTPNIFDAGALVYFGEFKNVTFGDSPPTLQQFADRYACSTELLLSANSDFTLPSTTTFLLPGTLAWPDDTTTLRFPYTIQDNDKLDDIAGHFSSVDNGTDASLQIAEMNERMPGTMVPNIDISVEVDGTAYTVNTGDDPSFYSVLTNLQVKAPTATLQDLVTSIENQTGILEPGGLLLCMPAKFSEADSPQNIKTLYGVEASSFALANTATQGLINPGQTLKSPDEQKTIQTEDNDTFNSLITRFADQGVTVDASQIAVSNMTVNMFKKDALALVPPAKIDFTVNIGDNGPYLNTISPLQVSVRLIRPEALIYPDFKTASGTGPVEMNESSFPPPMSNGAEEESGLNLNAFVEEVKEALPNIRLGTGQVSGVVQDLWYVDFGSGGINSVDLVGATTINGVKQPWFFALTPLYQHLVTRQQVEIAELQSDGSLGTPEPVSFQTVDVELWARRFLEDMDRFLSGSFAIALYDNKVGATQDSLQTVLDAKSTMIPKIADGLNSVLNISDTGKTDALTNAQKSLEQQLGVSLSRAYEATVLVQYESQVDSSSGADKASLYGDGSIVAEDVPSMSMVAAKTHLASNSTEPYVNFLITLDNPALNKDVSGSFNYTLSHLEFNISDVDIAEDYKSSDWLSFVPLLTQDEKPTALAGTDPGDVDVPIPLRIFPDLPIIVGHTASQAYKDGEATLSQEALWSYDFTYSHQHAEQDYVVITAEFNLTSPVSNMLMEEDSRDLFTELAQYNSVATSLWTFLNELPKEHTDMSPEDIKNAIDVFASLATNISSYWEKRLDQDDTRTNPMLTLEADMSYQYDTRVSRTDGFVKSLTLKKLSTDIGPDNKWPVAYVQKADGSFSLMEVASQSADEIVYNVPDDVIIPSTTWPVFKLSWTDLNVATIQNARSQMYVERNQDLLDGVSTNPDFIFSTETIVTPSVVTPLNTFGTRNDISDLGATLADALNQCFTDLFGTAAYGQKVTMELGYGFELVTPTGGSDQGLVTYLPIGLYPNQTLSATTGTDIEGIIEHWKSVNKPSETGGEWYFSIKLYSQLTDNPQTLLNIDYLIYKITE